MITAALLALQVAAADTVPAAVDTVPRISLGEAIRRSARLDPDYVEALGDIQNAEWGRRAAVVAFFVPAISLGLDETKYSTEFFNPSDPANPTSTLVVGSARADYEIFSLRKFAELGRTKAEVESAEAGELEQRFRAALETESSYYDVLVNQELARVAQERASRALEGLGVARARVASGAAVQTDSLQILLELNRARVGLLQDEARLRVARLALGRRVGTPGGVDAVPLDSARAPDLPLTLVEAMTQAVEQGPEYRAARASERAAEAAVRARRGSYLPSVFLSANETTFGDNFYPVGLTRRTLTVSLSYPLWDNANRELNYARARNAREVARAVRADLERAAEVDVTAGWEAYQTARATSDFSEQALIVAREVFRVQESRYRAGASTILDLLDAQSGLTQAQADLVQARYAARLALAGLEAILGRRLFSDKDPL